MKRWYVYLEGETAEEAVPVEADNAREAVDMEVRRLIKEGDICEGDTRVYCLPETVELLEWLAEAFTPYDDRWDGLHDQAESFHVRGVCRVDWTLDGALL